MDQFLPFTAGYIIFGAAAGVFIGLAIIGVLPGSLYFKYPLKCTLVAMAVGLATSAVGFYCATYGYFFS